MRVNWSLLKCVYSLSDDIWFIIIVCFSIKTFAEDNSSTIYNLQQSESSAYASGIITEHLSIQIKN